MEITSAEVWKIAELSKLHFTGRELEEFREQFQRILEYIEKLKEVNVEGVEPTSHVSLSAGSEKQVFRTDQTKESLPADEAVANAPDARQDQFRVPKVL